MACAGLAIPHACAFAVRQSRETLFSCCSGEQVAPSLSYLSSLKTHSTAVYSSVVKLPRAQKHLDQFSPHWFYIQSGNIKLCSRTSAISIMSRAGPPVAEHRTSLRRLSSLSSLATLNPFHRRRSNNVSDAPPPSQDGNYAVTARYLGKGSHTHLVANSTSLPNSDEVVVSQPKPTLAHSRRSYIPLPDDSYAPLPHSRTVSNLPVPVKAIKARGSASFSTSKSTAMLPPAQGNPTPPNQSAKGRLTSATKGILKTNRSTGLKRSDTMPLLNTNPELPCVSSTPRRTAFKENLTLSPIKPLPKMRMFSDEAGFHSPYQGDLPTIGRRFVSRDSILNSSADPTSRQAQHSASSPTKRNAARQHAVSRIVTSSGTQPVLKRMSHGAKTSKRVSYGAEIKQHQLLTPKAPPTPVAPLMRPSAVHSQARSVNNSSSVRKKQDTSPCGDRGTALPLVNPTHACTSDCWAGLC